MRHSNIFPRAIAGVRAETSGVQLVQQIHAAFDEFKATQNARMGKIEAAIDQTAADIAAARLGGGAGGDPSTLSAAAQRRAMANLGTFGRSGNFEALAEGLTISAAMRSGSDPDGGFLVPEELSSTIAILQRNDSVMRRLAKVVTTGSASFKQPVSVGGTASGWVGETSTRPQTEAFKLAMVEIHAGEIYANPAVTRNLLDDAAYDLGAFIGSEIAEEFNEQEGAAFLHGDGINKPRGFLDYASTNQSDAQRPFGKLQYVPSGAAATFATEDPADALIDLVFKLKAKYRQRASWIMNSTTLATISKFKDDNDNYIWQRSLSQGASDRLLGYPVEVDEGMPDVGANNFPVAFGDFGRGYMITDRLGFRLLRDELTNKPFVHFYTTKRVGGALVDSNAIKLFKIAAN